jgi:hypothetical protein
VISWLAVTGLPGGSPVFLPALAARQYAREGRTDVALYNAGQVLELSPSEVTALGAGNLRVTTAMAATAGRDQLGESVGASNSTIG